MFLGIILKKKRQIVAIFQNSILKNYLNNIDFESAQKSYDEYQNIFVPKMKI